MLCSFFFFSSRRRHTRLQGDWSSDVCSSDLAIAAIGLPARLEHTGQADGGYGVRQLRARAHGAPARGGDPEALEQSLLGHPVLAGGERRDRRTDTRSEERRVGEEGRTRWSPY